MTDISTIYKRFRKARDDQRRHDFIESLKDAKKTFTGEIFDTSDVATRKRAVGEVDTRVDDDTSIVVAKEETALQCRISLRDVDGHAIGYPSVSIEDAAGDLARAQIEIQTTGAVAAAVIGKGAVGDRRRTVRHMHRPLVSLKGTVGH